MPRSASVKLSKFQKMDGKTGGNAMQPPARSQTSGVVWNLASSTQRSMSLLPNAGPRAAIPVNCSLFQGSAGTDAACYDKIPKQVRIVTSSPPITTTPRNPSRRHLRIIIAFWNSARPNPRPTTFPSDLHPAQTANKKKDPQEENKMDPETTSARFRREACPPPSKLRYAARGVAQEPVLRPNAAGSPAQCGT